MTSKPDITIVMLKALWTAFKWPAAVFFGFMFVRMLIAPIWHALKRMFER
jgi:hypothetical protein